MKYKVSRQLKTGDFDTLAEILYLEDALAVYARWHSAIITRIADGVIIATKNLTTPSKKE